MDIRKKEALRYLGFRGKPADSAIDAMIDEVFAAALKMVQPKSIYREVSLRRITETETEIGGVVFRSRKLQAHLKNADRILVFAATLGVGADTLVRRYSANDDSAKAAVAQAVLASMIESYCDEICAQIAEKEEQNGYYLRPRFSPGYADLSLSSQRELFSILEITKRIGVTLNDACLMIPTKSVTAFIGLTREKQCQINACAACENRTCEFRREE